MRYAGLAGKRLCRRGREVERCTEKNGGGGGGFLQRPSLNADPARIVPLWTPASNSPPSRHGISHPQQRDIL